MFISSKKLFLMTIVGCITGFGVYRISTHIFSANQFHFSLDSKLSPAMHNAIKQAVYESYITSLAYLSNKIHNACPALDRITIERRASNALYIAITSEEPYVRIDNKILTTKGSIVDVSYFMRAAFAHLPLVIQKDSKGQATITHEFKQWLLSLDPSVFAAYDIVWNDDFSIQLVDKLFNHQMILCNVFIVPDTGIRELCQRIIEEKTICAQGTARKYEYTADIRFDNQIIICSHKGGACHG